MDVEPIFEGVRHLSALSTADGNKSRRYLGSLDPLTAHAWAKESGLRFGSKEWVEYCKKKLMTGPYLKYRADSARRVYNGYDLQ